MLDKTKLLDETHKKCNEVYQKIFFTGQLCFIKIGEGIPDLICLKKNLTKSSEFFALMLAQSNMKDIKHTDEGYIIDLECGQHWDKDDLQSIISYLHDGTPLDINEENFSTVFDLADFFGIDSLKEDCFNFYKGNLTESNFKKVLDASYQIPSLRLLCVEFINANKEFQITDPNVKDKDSLNQAIQAIQTLLQKKSVLIWSSFRGAELELLTKDSLKDIVKINSLIKSRDSSQPLTINSLVVKTSDTGETIPEWSELIAFIKEHPEISSLDLRSAPAITQEQLNELSEILPNLNTFFIKNDKIASIPTNILERVEGLSCAECPSLTTLNVPKATWLSCGGCTSLTTLNAPKATELTFYGCTSLTTLNAPKATWLSCRGCTSLTTLNAPKATELYCNDCTSLTTLNAPKATELSCRGCPSLTTLNVPGMG